MAGDARGPEGRGRGPRSRLTQAWVQYGSDSRLSQTERALFAVSAVSLLLVSSRLRVE